MGPQIQGFTHPGPIRTSPFLLQGFELAGQSSPSWFRKGGWLSKRLRVTGRPPLLLWQPDTRLPSLGLRANRRGARTGTGLIVTSLNGPTKHKFLVHAIWRHTKTEQTLEEHCSKFDLGLAPLKVHLSVRIKFLLAFSEQRNDSEGNKKTHCTHGPALPCL